MHPHFAAVNIGHVLIFNTPFVSNVLCLDSVILEDNTCMCKDLDIDIVGFSKSVATPQKLRGITVYNLGTLFSQTKWNCLPSLLLLNLQD